MNAIRYLGVLLIGCSVISPAMASDFDGSKPLNTEELATAWAPQRPWSRAATSGYSFLQSAGQELVADGVDFHDLSLIFQSHQETIYSDICCHYNERGYKILGRMIGKLVGQRLTEHDARYDDN